MFHSSDEIKTNLKNSKKFDLKLTRTSKRAAKDRKNQEQTFEVIYFLALTFN